MPLSTLFTVGSERPAFSANFVCDQPRRPLAARNCAIRIKRFLLDPFWIIRYDPKWIRRSQRGESQMSTHRLHRPYLDRRQFIGGSDARIIMGDDQAALVRLWREKRGEIEPED